MPYAAFSECENLTNVYYSGTKDDFERIEIGNENDNLINATHYYLDTNI